MEDAIGSPLRVSTLIGAIWISQGATRVDSDGTRVDTGRPRWCPQRWCPLIFYSHKKAPRWGPQQWCPLIFDARKEAPVVVPTKLVPTNLRIVFDVFKQKISGHRSSYEPRDNALDPCLRLASDSRIARKNKKLLWKQCTSSAYA